MTQRKAQPITSSPYEAIPRLFASYATALDDGDLATFRELFSQSTLGDEDNPKRYSGAQGAEQMLRDYTKFYDSNENLVELGVRGATPRTFHSIGNFIVEPSDDNQSASCRASFIVFQQLSDFPLQPIIQGRYRDRFVLDEGAWRYAERIFLPRLYGDLSRHLKQGI